jgi:hypothetical protein
MNLSFGIDVHIPVSSPQASYLPLVKTRIHNNGIIPEGGLSIGVEIKEESISICDADNITSFPRNRPL